MIGYPLGGTMGSVKFAVPLVLAAMSFGSARVAREVATAERKFEETNPPPFAPSVGSARLVALGYRELFADLLYVRLRGYYGEWYGTKAGGIAALSEAIAALDPRFERIYEYGGNAMTIAEFDVDQSVKLRALAFLDQGMNEFPRSYSLPMLAGQIYLQDLHTEDRAQRRAWDEKGALLVESAIRKPGAPINAATYAATIRTELGQRDRAAEGLRELLLTTRDERARKRLIDRLAKVAGANADEVAAEILDARKHFDRTWKTERPSLKPSMYLLVGPPSAPGFDLRDLATGGRDLMIVDSFQHLEPLVHSEEASVGTSAHIAPSGNASADPPDRNSPASRSTPPVAR